MSHSETTARHNPSDPSPQSQRRWIILALLSFAGAIIGAYLSSHYYQVRSGTLGFKSSCNFGSHLNCDVVAASPYAEFLSGLPLSSFVAGWLLGLCGISLMGVMKEWKREALRIAFGMTLFSSALSVLYFLVMAFVLKTYCLFCLFIDGINLISLGIVLSMKPEGFKIHKMNGAQWKSLLGIVAGCVFVAVVGLKGMDELNLNKERMQEMVDSALSSPVVAVESGEEFPSIGPKNARVTLVEFSDFQCPYCRLGAFALNTVYSRFPNDLRIVFRNFPLDPSCNKEMQTGGHPIACEAARTGLCAFKQGKFEEYYKEIFQRQLELAPGKPEEIAKELGLDGQRLAECTKTDEISSKVQRDLEEGTRLGISSTPTFFINGHKVVGLYPTPVWIKIIETLLHSTPDQSPEK